MVKSEAVYQAIVARIQEGFWKSGEQILSERQLSSLFSVSRVTVRNAISQLVGEGVLEYRQGRLGTFVAAIPCEKQNEDAGLIGIALDNYTPAFASFLLEGIHDSLWKRNYHTLYCNTHLGDETVVQKIASFIQEGVKGLIFSPLLTDSGTVVSRKVLALAKQASIPVVQLDRYVWDNHSSKVQCDNTDAMYRMMQRLIKLGIRRPLVLSGISTSSTEERLEGVRRACSEQGISVSTVLVDEVAYYQEQSITFLDPKAMKLEAYDAFIALNQVLSKVAVRLAKNCHSQIITAGVSASELEVVNEYSVIQPLYHIGYTAASLLLEHIEKPDIPQSTILVQARQWPFESSDTASFKEEGLYP